MSGDVLHFPQQRVRDVRDTFPRLLTQADINAQEAAQKRRALFGIAGQALRVLVYTIGILGLLGFITGV